MVIGVSKLSRAIHPEVTLPSGTNQKTVDNMADYFETLDVLAQNVGVEGVFSDWPATVSTYASAMGLN